MFQLEAQRKGAPADGEGAPVPLHLCPGWTDLGWRGQEQGVKHSMCEGSCTPVGTSMGEIRRNRLRTTNPGEVVWPKEKEATSLLLEIPQREL